MTPNYSPLKAKVLLRLVTLVTLVMLTYDDGPVCVALARPCGPVVAAGWSAQLEAVCVTALAPAYLAITILPPQMEKRFIFRNSHHLCLCFKPNTYLVIL